MKVQTKLFLTGLSPILLLIIIGCGGGGTSTSTTGVTDNNGTNLSVSYKEDAGRLLGSQCAQCHGTDGISTNDWDSIAGESDLIDEIYDDEPIMSAQAHGYTTEEIVLIGDWLTTLQNND